MKRPFLLYDNSVNLGFTLIEVLVVIVIIGVITSLTMITLNGVRSKSRDAKRISDVRQLQSALAIYNNDHNDYPASLTGGSALVGANGQTYIKMVPVAPGRADGACTTANDSYAYVRDSAISYHINYCLGGAVQSAGPSVCCAVPGSICLSEVASGGSSQSTSYQNAGLGGSDYSIGDYDWSDGNSILAQDGSYAYVAIGQNVHDYSVKLIKGGVVSGNNLAKAGLWTDNGQNVEIYEDIVYGGPSEMWGLSLTTTDVNAVNFGIAFAAQEDGMGNISNYLTATDFNLNVPAGKTITGIEATVRRAYWWNSASFPAGTLISTPYGQQAIETVKPGDEVWSLDKFGRLTVTKVNQIKTGQSNSLIVLHLDAENLLATPEHRILTPLGYVPAKHLNSGDTVYLVDDGQVRYAKISSVARISGDYEVYNFTVDREHNYLANNLVVSNGFMIFETRIDNVKLKAYYSN